MYISNYTEEYTTLYYLDVVIQNECVYKTLVVILEEIGTRVS